MAPPAVAIPLPDPTRKIYNPNSLRDTLDSLVKMSSGEELSVARDELIQEFIRKDCLFSSVYREETDYSTLAQMVDTEYPNLIQKMYSRKSQLGYPERFKELVDSMYHLGASTNNPIPGFPFIKDKKYSFGYHIVTDAMILVSVAVACYEPLCMAMAVFPPTFKWVISARTNDDIRNLKDAAQESDRYVKLLRSVSSVR